MKKERDGLYKLLKIAMLDSGVYDIHFSKNDSMEGYSIKIVIPDNPEDELIASLIFPNSK